MTIFGTCKNCSRPIPQGDRYCGLCQPSAPQPRPAGAHWSKGRQRREQDDFRRRMLALYGGQCAAVGGLTVFVDLPQGTRCPVRDAGMLQAHHGKGGMPDMLLCDKHHAEVDPHARVRR